MTATNNAQKWLQSLTPEQRRAHLSAAGKNVRERKGVFSDGDDRAKEAGSKGGKATARIRAMEPDYIAQTGDVDTADPNACRAWFRERGEESKARGIAALARMSISDDRKLLLFESWRVRPDDQGEPRWQLSTTSVKAGNSGEVREDDKR